MEWIDGVKLTDKARMAEYGLSVVDFVDVGIECTLRQLLDKGYFHAGALRLLPAVTPAPHPPRTHVMANSLDTITFPMASRSPGCLHRQIQIPYALYVLPRP